MDTQTTAFRPPPPLPGIEPDIKVGFILSPQFTILAFAAFMDSLRHAADEADFSRQIYCSWSVISDQKSPISASCGVEILPEQGLVDPASFNYVVVVGGLLPGSLDVSDEVIEYLRRAYNSNVSIVGLCTGSFILAKAGLLWNRRCAVHVEHRDQLATMFPDAIPVVDQVYVEDRGIWTCPGGTSALDLAFHLIETHCGRARAVKGLTSLLVERRRTAERITHRPHGHLAVCGNRKVEMAVEIMEKYISSPYQISRLASQVGCSRRQLNRAFEENGGSGPLDVWRDMRLAHGNWLLLNSDRSVTQISMECGFADSAHFSRWFRKAHGEAPEAFRRNRLQVIPTRSSLGKR